MRRGRQIRPYEMVEIDGKFYPVKLCTCCYKKLPITEFYKKTTTYVNVAANFIEKMTAVDVPRTQNSWCKKCHNKAASARKRRKRNDN